MRIRPTRSLARVSSLTVALLVLAIVPAAASAAPKKAKLGFSASAYTAIEGNSFTVVVVRTGNTRVPATVDYTTQNGTAAAGADYTAASGTLSFAVGETRKTISVATIDNLIAGPANKTFTMKLSNGQPDSVPPGKTTATLRILDNDGPGTIDFSSASYSVVEGAGVATITVTRASASNITESVDYTTTELAVGAGHAIAGTDYTTTTGTLTFGTGEMSKSFQVPIADDSDFEGDETLDVTLSNPQNITNPLQPPDLGTNNPATLTIVDDDVSTFDFDQPTYTVAENVASGTKTITVVRGGATNVAADIDYSDAHTGTATPGVPPAGDYVAFSGTLHFAPGETTKTFDVAITDDSVADEGNETIGLQLTEGGTQVATALLSIVDDESLPSVQFSNVEYNVSEANPSVTVTVTLSEPADGKTVDYATSDGVDLAHATAGSDYTAKSGTLTFANGETSKTITIDLLGDSDPEDDEDFRVTLSNASAGLQLGDPNPAKVTILDDDGTGSLEFSALSYNADESSGHASVLVRRVGGSGGMASVDYTTADGTAHAPGDYTDTSGTLLFGDGETEKTIDVPIAFDGLAEGDETVSISLSNFVSDDAPGANKAAVIHIADAGASGPVQFSAASYDVSEKAGSASIAVTRTGSLGGPVTVDYAGTDGTHGTLTFGAGDSSESFQVPVVDDNVHTGTRTVNLTLSNPGGGTSLGSPAAAALNIADDEPVSSASTDRTAPRLKIAAKKLQKALTTKKIVLKVKSNEAASLKVTTKIRTGAKKTVVVVQRVSRKVGAGKTVKITIKLNKTALRSLRNALVRGKVKVILSVKGTDAARNSATVTKTITVK
jgi:hypothetical protein